MNSFFGLIKNKEPLGKKNLRSLTGFLSFSKNKSFWWIIYTIIAFLIIFLVAKQVQKQQSLNSEAAANQAVLFFETNTAVVPPDVTAPVWLKVEYPISFFHTEITFDPQVVKLSNEVALENSLFGRIIKISSMSEANSTGRVVLVIALDPSLRASPPTGVMKMVSLNFTHNTQTPNSSATIKFDLANTEIVNKDAIALSVSSSDLVLSVNPVVPSPTPTTAPIPTKTSTPVPTIITTSLPVRTPTSVPTRTATPKPTEVSSPTPTPSSIPGVPPTIIISKPYEGQYLSGSRQAIFTKSMSSSGISSVTISFDGAVLKTCLNSYSCKTYVYLSGVASGPHRISVKAVDKSSSRLTSEKIITVYK